MRSKEAREKAQALSIFETIEDSSYLQDLLVIAISDSQKTFFIDKLLVALPQAFAGYSKPPPGLFHIMTGWFGKFKGSSSQFIAMAAACKQRHDHFIAHRHKKVDFINRIGLNWSPATRDHFIANTRTFFLTKLSTPYPIVQQWICETDSINSKWADYLQNDPKAQPDRRRPRLPIFHMNPAKLQLDIETDKNALVYDRNSGELIMLVIRNFCSEPNLLSHIDDVIKQAVDYRRSMRVCHFNQFLMLYNNNLLLLA